MISKTQAQKILSKRLQESNKAKKIFDGKFPQQEAFCKDPARLKALFCTRRASKSFTAGLYMIKTCLENPGVNCLFLGLTRESTKEIIWKDILKAINKKYNLQCKFNLSDLTMTFPNGSVIRVTGVDSDESEMNKLLGKKYKLVCIDEASMYTINLRHLVYDILSPATADQQGTICLFGTSSNYSRGLFYDITTKKEAGWSLHSWTAFENPYIDWAKHVNEILSTRPLYIQTPQYKQWYLNEWIVETDKLVYKYNESKNNFKTLPKLKLEGWTYILGVDLGWEDDNAFILTAYHQQDPSLYVVSTFNKPHMTFDEVVNKINEFMGSDTPPSKVIIDGANKQGVESMRVRSSIPFEYADKTGKVDFIELLNNDLIQAKVKIKDTNKNLIDELMSLVWVTDGDKIKYPKKENPSLSNHLCDAFLYAWRCGYHYQSVKPEDKLVKGSREWYVKQSNIDWNEERERLEQGEGKGQWGDNDGGWSNL